MLKKILFILFIVVICSNTSFAQRKDTLSVDSITLVGAIAYHPNVDKLLFSGYRITGPNSFSAFLGIKNFKTGKVEVLPTYIVDIFPGYNFRSGEVYGWLDDDHVLIKQMNIAKDSTHLWTVYNVHTMQCEEVKFEHEISANTEILVDDGAIIYMPWDASGAKNVYRYDFYSNKTTLHYSFQWPGYLNLLAFSQSKDRLFFYRTNSNCLNYLQNNRVEQIPKIYYGDGPGDTEIRRFDFRYDAGRDKLYFITRVNRTIDHVSNITTPEALVIQTYDFRTDDLYTLDTIPISMENYWDIRGFEIFREESLLLSIEKRLTEEEEQKNSIEGPVLNLKIWDMDVTIPTRLNLQKLLIKISAQQ